MVVELVEVEGRGADVDELAVERGLDTVEGVARVVPVEDREVDVLGALATGAVVVPAMVVVVFLAGGLGEVAIGVAGFGVGAGRTRT